MMACLLVAEAASYAASITSSDVEFANMICKGKKMEWQMLVLGSLFPKDNPASRDDLCAAGDRGNIKHLLARLIHVITPKSLKFHFHTGEDEK